MKVSAAVLAAFAAVGAAQAAGNIQPLILSGTVVPLGTKTYNAGLRQTMNGVNVCGGSLITPTHVLSAGHCARFGNFISIGAHFRNDTVNGEIIAVKTKTLHPKYEVQGDISTYDLILIELASPSKYPPVKLLSADPETLVGAYATTMGWGSTREDGPFSAELLRVDVPVVSDAQCKRIQWSFNATVTESMFCAGGEMDKDGCQGDSGGPIILEQDAGDVQVGLVSWGDGCGAVNFPGVYSKVSAAKDWILSLAPDAVFV